MHTNRGLDVRRKTMNEENEESESDSLQSDPSSSEGDYSIYNMIDNTDFPKFDVSSWDPQPPAGINYLCLIPFGSSYKSEYDQSHAGGGKLKVSASHRQQRMKEFKSGRTTGRNMVDEKRLRNAANQNDFTTVVALLEGGVDANSSDDKKRTALHFAASQGYEIIVKLLLDKGADPNQKDVLGNTPLHLAACTGQVPVVTFLLRAGTDLKSVDRFGRTPLTLAKSRLNFLADNKSYSSTQIKDETLQICDMMKTYLSLRGSSQEALELDKLCEQLRTVTTREEVDQVSNLLSQMSCLSLNKKEKPG